MSSVLLERSRTDESRDSVELCIVARDHRVAAAVLLCQAGLSKVANACLDVAGKSPVETVVDLSQPLDTALQIAKAVVENQSVHGQYELFDRPDLGRRKAKRADLLFETEPKIFEYSEYLADLGYSGAVESMRTLGSICSSSRGCKSV